MNQTINANDQAALDRASAAGHCECVVVDDHRYDGRPRAFIGPSNPGAIRKDLERALRLFPESNPVGYCRYLGEWEVVRSRE